MPDDIYLPKTHEKSPAGDEAFIIKPRGPLVRPTVDQQFDWGHMHWLIEPGRTGMERIGVGFTTFYINGVDVDHYHMGSTQVVYIVSGFGHHLVNGTRYDFEAGDTLYIPPYARHEMANDSATEDLLVLGVYMPINEKPFLGEYRPKVCHLRDHDNLLSLIDVQVIEDILNRLARTLNQSIQLIDHDGSCLISSRNQAPLCRLLQEKCGGHCRQNLRRAIERLSVVEKSEMFICCGRVASIITPIVSENVIRGFIKCGEFFFNSGDREEMAGYLRSNTEAAGALAGQDLEALLGPIKIDKKHAVHAAAEDTLSMARFIAEMAVNLARQKAEERARLDILEARMAESKLKQDLQSADLKLLESQLNPHFLFNTLNTIEHLAYLEGADQISHLILSLAKLLRTALGKTRGLIAMREEIKLLRGYLDIQKARFGPRLNDSLAVDPGALGCLIPGLTLQPLVENTIVHGVESNQGHCRVNVRVARTGPQLNIRVEDNGPGFRGMTEGVGLRSVRARLAHYFGQDYHFELTNKDGGGVVAELRLRAEEEAAGSGAVA